VAVYPEPLLETTASQDPMTQFEHWFREAQREFRMPEAMALATVGPDLKPSARMVLARGWDERGFVFYTDYRSRKSDEIEANPRGALLFYWNPPGRQVRIEGPLGRISPEESDEYFATRARGSQIAAHASMQSHLIKSRDALDARVLEEASRFEGSPIPRPSGWGGFRLVPETMEFWQQRDDRLHDRLLYSREPQGWRVERLQP
jgi:pyridoxamine 5'-phosphate oxidase